MHVRCSRCIGKVVVEERERETLGVVEGILLDPDRGTVDGFFVRSVSRHREFCPVAAIRRFATQISVAPHALAPLEDHVRLQERTADPRTVLGQQMITETGRRLGKCCDVQFETTTFCVQKLYPRRWWRTREPIPVQAIVEVRSDAVIVRETLLAVPAQEKVIGLVEAALPPTAG
jgi:uncharacterized protein YrrD